MIAVKPCCCCVLLQSGVVSALMAKPANDLAALQNVITALTTKPNITMPNLSIDLVSSRSSLQHLASKFQSCCRWLPAHCFCSMFSAAQRAANTSQQKHS
jgi:hypothetical protein